MPNTKGAKKRLRQNLVRRDRNRAQKTRFRHTLRQFREAVAAKKLDEAKELSVATAKLLDKAAASGVIHRNKAARLKSRMSHLLVVAPAASCLALGPIRPPPEIGKHPDPNQNAKTTA